jgi:hypothetical protein
MEILLMTVMEIPIALMAILLIAPMVPHTPHMAILLIALMVLLTLPMETQPTVQMALPILRMAIPLMALMVVLPLLMEIQSITLPQIIRMMTILTTIFTDIIITKIVQICKRPAIGKFIQ